MDKETLSNYGWIIVVALVGVIMLTMATPLGNYIFANIKSTAIEEFDDSSLGQDEPSNDVVGMENKKDIQFELQGGEFVGGYVSTYIPGTEVTLPMNVHKEHYDFGGWYADSSCNGDNITKVGLTETTNLKFYAKWIPKQFVITYNLNGGNFTQPNNVQYYYSYGKPFSIPTATNYGGIQKTEHTFKGWYNANTDTLFTYTNTISGNIVLYAKWEKNS